MGGNIRGDLMLKTTQKKHGGCERTELDIPQVFLVLNVNSSQCELQPSMTLC